jgi:tRNA-guanine family transglycosylase
MITKTPFLLFTQTIKGVPKPWKYFKIDGIMVNAYEILQSPEVNEEIQKQKIHNFLDFRGLVTIDSGGFFFMRKKILDVKPETILQLYKKSKPNYGVVLDYPIALETSAKEIRKRQLKTLENIRIMTELHDASNPELIPVIHGHNVKSIEWYLSKLNQISEFETYGVGSLVPAVRNQRGSNLTIYDAVKIISYLRKKLPDKKIHVFGVGSTLTLHLIFYAGADSVDSSSWRTKAAFGAVQLPGVGDRYITKNKKRKNYPDLSKNEKRLIENCKCPACKNHSLQELKKSFVLRALHNAWVYQKEIETVRKQLRNGGYNEYVYEVLKGTRFFKVLKFIENSGAFEKDSQL